MFFVLFGIICFNAHSQHVPNEYIKKKVSAESGQFVISNKFEIAKNGLENIEAMISMLKSRNSDSIVTIISLSIFQEPSVSINKGDTCLIKLSNNRILIFTSMNSCTSKKGGDLYLISPDYRVNDEDIQQLKTYPIHKIRIKTGYSYRDWDKISVDTNTKFTNFCLAMDKCMNEQNKSILDDF